jgi:predicted dehydrogenase
VRAGEIGDVRHVVCQMASALHDLLGGQPMSETQGQRFRPPASTWADPDRAGGYGWGQLAHALGVLFGIADLRATEVFAWMGVSPSGADYYDAIVVRFANDATGVISGSATIPKPAGARHDRSKGYQIDLRMFGSQGMLLLDVERERLEIRRNDGRDTVLPLHKGDGDYPAAAPWAHFIDLVLGRTTENPMPGDTGVKTVEVLEAAYRSAVGGGRIVYISEL